MLWRANELLISLLVSAALLMAVEIGYRIGSRYRGHQPARSTYISSLQTGLLGLLALLLGFTIAMAVSRYDKRKDLVVEEANDIGTTYLRASLLPADAAESSRQLLRDYLSQRLAFHSAGIDATQLTAAGARSSSIQQQLWQIAEQQVRANPGAHGPALYVQTLNEMIDVSEKRLAALDNHVPETILYLLFAVACGGLVFAGYTAGLAGRRFQFSSAAFALLIALTLVTVLDLDRPRRGLIRVSQDSMIRLQAVLNPP